ncbi:MAG: hypothetical protein IJX69_01205 [Oscillospiraceae bacterium]|nr:hypothetical protein [Oscillospiraceae bacterium]
MKRIYSILCAVFLAVLLLGGLISTFDKDATYSESERRKLKTAPKLTFSGLLDGSYFDNYEAYFADTFPNRESLMESNVSLNGFYYFGGLSSDENASLILDFSSNGSAHGEALKDPNASTGGEAESDPTEETTYIPQQTDPPMAAEKLGSVVLVGDSAFDVSYANREAIQRYAATVTDIADLLGEDVKTFCMPVPNSAEFYTHSQYHTGSASQRDMFALCKENLGSNVTYVDAYSVLAQHTNEYIYFRTDHHWTHLGAYYAYTALCKSAGFTPESQDKFATGKWENFVGSMYTYVSSYPQGQVLKNNPDTVHYWKPYVDCTTYYYSSTSMSDPVLMGTICKIPEDADNKYLTFMGGDHPLTIVETDVSGPCILVIKESYGNALISWLTSHYSKIILIDPREYFAINSDIELKSFCESQGVDQCLVINYPMMLNSEGYIGRMEQLVK